MFNTLGTVLSLIDVDTARARQMLEAFIDYLRNSLGKLRTSDSTLGDELDLAQAYLSLMQHRMGDRLDFAIDVSDPALRQAAMPPLLIQPLVENAIQHGLECKVEGGKVLVAARREGDSLVVDVTDDGLGQCVTPVRRTGPPGNGVALKNLRERLAARYGANAALELDIRPDAGARASLRIPIDAQP
jgi:sensor histidine kinase YesM